VGKQKQLHDVHPTSFLRHQTLRPSRVRVHAHQTSSIPALRDPAVFPRSQRTAKHDKRHSEVKKSYQKNGIVPGRNYGRIRGRRQGHHMYHLSRGDGYRRRRGQGCW